MKIERMYINEANKLNYRDRLRIIKQLTVYNRKPSDLAKQHGVSRQTIYAIYKRYMEDGLYGIEDHRPGVKRHTLNPLVYDLIVQIRLTTDYSSMKIQQQLNKSGFGVSKYRIQKVILAESHLRKKMGKQAKPKYVRYEAENCNDLWHIDWSQDPVSGLKLLAVQDDKSRFIVFAGLFEEATAENSAIGVQKAINRYGVPKEIVSDNGSHFKKPHSQGVVVSPLRELEEKYGIKHIFIRPYYPQSNGKIERMFGSYKIEFPRMQHPKVKDCLTWMHYHNFERLHQSLNYETPAHVYLGVNSI